jgi:hypothetical protein
MNWDAIGATGDILGAFAVVISLGYVAVQIRQNTKATRQQSYHDLVTRRSQWFYALVATRDVANIRIAGAAGETFDRVDSQRFVALMINFMSHFQDVYLQRATGIVEEHVWLAERRFLAAVNSAPGFVDWWKSASQYFLPEFVQEVAKVKPIDMVSFDQETAKWARSTKTSLRSQTSQ